MHWEVIRAGADNWSYLLGDPLTHAAAVVDPLNAEEILARLRQGRWNLVVIFLTHGHPDHTGGCPRLLEATRATVWSHPPDGVTGARALSDGSEIEVGSLQVKVLHTPGHTAGSACYLVEDKFITGDTVFLAGAGNCLFGGNVDDLYQSFREKILPLDPGLELCPGHDYAENNLCFALSLEPGSDVIQAKLSEARKAAAEGRVPASTLAEERRYNPFFRFAEAALRSALARSFPRLDLSDPAACFAAIRVLRNSW